MAWQEILSQRRQKAKAWVDGRAVWCVASLAPLHYASGGPDSLVHQTPVVMAPQPVLDATLDGWRVTDHDWHYALGRPAGRPTDGWVGFGGRQGQQWLWRRLVRCGYLHWPTRAWQDVSGAPTYSRANLAQVPQTLTVGPTGAEQALRLGTEVIWTRIWTTPGGGRLDLAWRTDSLGLKEEVRLNATARQWIVANRPPVTPAADTFFGFVFQLDVADIPRWLKGGVAQNLSGDFEDEGTTDMQLRDATERLLAFMPVSHAYTVDAVTGGRTAWLPLRSRVWLDPDGQRYLMVGARVPELTALPAGPIHFDPTLRVADTAEDGWSWGTTEGIAAAAHPLADATIGWNATQGDMDSAWIFRATGVPQGAAITGAFLTLGPLSGTVVGTPTGAVWGFAVDSPTAFNTTDTHRISDHHPRTSASVTDTFTATSGAHTTPNIAAVVQEVVNRAGYAGDIGVTWRNTGSTTADYAFADVDDGADRAAYLSISYTGGPITFLAAGTEGSAASGTMTLGTPPVLAVNDVWLAAIHSSDQVAHTLSGWTQLFQANGGGTTSRLSVWYHRYAGTVPNLVVGHTAGVTIIGGIAVFRGCKTSGSPANVVGTGGAGIDASIEVTGVTPSVAGCLLVVVDGAADDNVRSIVPTGFLNCFEDVVTGTQRAYVSTAGTPNGSVAMHWKAHTTGATGNFTDTQAAADPWASVLIALEPDQAAATPAVRESVVRVRSVGQRLRDSVVRVRLWVAAVRDVASRTRLVAPAVKDAPSRVRAHVQGLRDVPSRLRSAVPRTRDVVARLAVTARDWHEVTARWRLTLASAALKDLTVRLSVGVASWRNVSARWRVTAAAIADLPARLRLLVPRVRDTQSRVRSVAASVADGRARLTVWVSAVRDLRTRATVAVRAFEDIVSRVRVIAHAWRPIASRFAVIVPGQTIRDVVSRVVLAVARIRDIAARVVSVVSVVRDIRSRLRLSVARVREVRARLQLSVVTLRDVMARLRLIAPGVRDLTGRLSLRAQSWRVTVSRFRLVVPGASLREALGRVVLTAREWADAGGRVSLAVRRVTDAAARLRLLGLSVREAAARVVVQVPAVFRETAARLRLWGQSWGHAQARWRLWGTTLRDVALRGRLVGRRLHDISTRAATMALALGGTPARFRLQLFVTQAYRGAKARIALIPQTLARLPYRMPARDMAVTTDVALDASYAMPVRLLAVAVDGTPMDYTAPERPMAVVETVGLGPYTMPVRTMTVIAVDLAA